MRTLACLFLLAALTPGCGGTESGNPTSRSMGSYKPIIKDTEEGQENFAIPFLVTLCRKLEACYQLNGPTCEQEILDTTSIDTEIGLPSGFGTFYDVFRFEIYRQIEANPTAANRCLADIEALSCSSSEVTQAYDPANPTDFSQVFRLFSTSSGSCPDVY